MNEEVELLLNDAKDQMTKSILHLEGELSKIRTGKASVNMLDPVKIDYYGIETPLNQAATVSTPDARTIMVKPFEKSLLPEVEKGIHAANIGLNPMNDGEFVRINIPPLTEDRRKELVKQARQDGEQSKVSIRNVRREVNDEIKKLQKEGLSEDLAKDAEDRVQELTDGFISKVDKYMTRKEEDIMKV